MRNTFWNPQLPTTQKAKTMTKLAFEIEIDAPAEKVWEEIADFGNISKFNPSVPTSHLTAEQTQGVGTTRHCDLYVAGASIEERIIDWVDGESYQVEVYDGKRVPPTERQVARVSTRPNGPDSSIARMEMEYELKGGLLGKAADKGMMRNQFGKAAGGLLAGLKHYVETGEEVTHPREIKQYKVTAA